MHKVSNQDAFVSRAVLRGLRVTPQKTRRVVNIIRGERADVALTTLKFANQPVSKDIYTLIASAVANAKQKNPAIRDASELWVAEALVDEGFTLKRFRPRAQGRGFGIDKRSSQVTVVLSDDVNYRSYGPRKASARKASAKPAAEAAAPVAKKAPAKSAKKSAPKKAAATEGKAE